MKKLDDYLRLESSARWHLSRDDAGRPVVVTLSKSHLTIVSRSDQPLAHWSFQALRQINPGQMPAIFTPDSQNGGETIELFDQQFAEMLQRMLAKGQKQESPQKASWSLPIYGFLLMMSLLAGIYYFSAPIAAGLAGFVSSSERDFIGERTFALVDELLGERCRTINGDRILVKLAGTILNGEAEIRVVRSHHQITAHLPSSILVITDSLLREHDQFAIIGGFLLEEKLRSQQTDSVASLFRQMGLLAAARFFLHRKLDESDLEIFVTSQIFNNKRPVDRDELIVSFKNAGLSILPFAQANNLTEVIAASRGRRGSSQFTPPVSDQEWLDLQNLCFKSYEEG